MYTGRPPVRCICNATNERARHGHANLVGVGGRPPPPTTFTDEHRDARPGADADGESQARCSRRRSGGVALRRAGQPARRRALMSAPTNAARSDGGSEAQHVLLDAQDDLLPLGDLAHGRRGDPDDPGTPVGGARGCARRAPCAPARPRSPPSWSCPGRSCPPARSGSSSASIAADRTQYPRWPSPSGASAAATSLPSAWLAWSNIQPRLPMRQLPVRDSSDRVGAVCRVCRVCRVCTSVATTHHDNTAG